MPAPTNTTALTATAVGALPYTVTQDVNFGGTTYDVWYKYTATADGVIGVLAFGDWVNYEARISVYSPDSVTTYLNLFQFVNVPLQFPVTNGVVYYFFIESRFGSPVTPAILTLTVTAAPVDAADIGDFLINDDTEGFHAVVLSQTDGVAKRFAALVAGEAGDILPSGISAFTNDDEAPPLTVSLYDTDLALIATTTALTTGGFTPSLRSNNVDKFYVNDFNGVVHTINSAGVFGGTTWTLPLKPKTMAPSRDDTILYWSRGNANDPMKRWDLINDIALSDLAAAPSALYGARFDTLVLANGHILVTWRKIGAVPEDSFIREYSAAGATIRDYTITYPGNNGVEGPRLAIPPADDSTEFLLWNTGAITSPIAGTNLSSRFAVFQTSDGSAVTFDRFVFEEGVGPKLAAGWPTFGSSKSCPFVALRAEIAGPTATLTVVKVTLPIEDPSASFDFTGTGAGVDPTFSLVGGGSTVFEDLAPGTYGVAESGLPFGWVAVSHTVSNGDPINAIELAAGDDVTVTFYNRDTNAAAGVFRRLDPRRMRRAPHLNLDHKRTIFNAFELLAQVGAGLTEGQGSDPVILMRFSDDGGMTWSEYKPTSLGKLGEYRTRVRWTRLGQARDRVFEVVVSDPVDCSLISAYVDASKGTS